VELPPFVLAILTFLGLAIAGGILMGLGITFIGIIVLVLSVPGALVAWLAAD